MIKLVRDNMGAHDTVAMMKAFANEEELWKHIRKRVRLKQASTRWQFSYYSPHTLADVMAVCQERSFTEAAMQACEQGHSLIVIRQGEKKPLAFVAAPELDAAKLKRDWCKNYIKAHQLLIVRE